MIEDFKINLRDSTELKNWVKRKEEEEKVNQIKHLQEKKAEMELAREAAIKSAEE